MNVLITFVTQLLISIVLIHHKFQSLCEIYKNDINVEEAIVEYDTFKDVYASIRPSLSSKQQLKDVLSLAPDGAWSP